MKYKVVRRFFRGRSARVILSKVTLKEAQEWCNHKETSSSTCEESRGIERTERYGPWFDSYQEQR